MAVSPDIIKSLNSGNIKRLEEFIDSLLIKESHTGRTSLTLSVPKDMNREEWKVLRQKYISVGWKSVEWRSEQRDGDWLEFSM